MLDAVEAQEAAAWWRRVVEPAIARSRAELQELARARPRGDHPVDTGRWRRAARLPVLAAALPGFADLWQQKVPDDALERTGEVWWITCRCGVRHLVEVGVVVMCGCERWFLRTAQDVRVKVWGAR